VAEGSGGETEGSGEAKLRKGPLLASLRQELIYGGRPRAPSARSSESDKDK
jgi:hypothetical protein